MKCIDLVSQLGKGMYIGVSLCCYQWWAKITWSSGSIPFHGEFLASHNLCRIFIIMMTTYHDSESC